MMLSVVPMATGPVGEAPSNENQRKGGNESWMVQVVRQLVQRPWGGCDRTGEVARKGQAVESAVSLGLGIPPK